MTPTATAAKPIKLLTTCRHCKQQFRALPFGVPVLGEEPPERLMKFVMMLIDHMNMGHRDIMATVGKSIQDFTGMLILNQFETADTGLALRADEIRAELHKRTRKHFVTDAAILDLVSRVGLDQKEADTVAALMRAMRDAYEELGAYSPQQQAQNLVVPA